MGDAPDRIQVPRRGESVVPRTKEADQAWRDANRELVKTYNREYSRKRRADPKRREKILKQAAAWRSNPKNRPAILSGRLKHDYGISIGQYEEMLAEQHGVCFLCRRAESKVITGKVVRLAVDHDHKTGLVRRLLCSNCNTAIGLLDENPDRARALAAYLEQFTNREVQSFPSA